MSRKRSHIPSCELLGDSKGRIYSPTREVNEPRKNSPAPTLHVWFLRDPVSFRSFDGPERVMFLHAKCVDSSFTFAESDFMGWGRCPQCTKCEGVYHIHAPQSDVFLIAEESFAGCRFTGCAFSSVNLLTGALLGHFPTCPRGKTGHILKITTRDGKHRTASHNVTTVSLSSHWLGLL